MMATSKYRKHKPLRYTLKERIEKLRAVSGVKPYDMEDADFFHYLVQKLEKVNQLEPKEGEWFAVYHEVTHGAVR